MPIRKRQKSLQAVSIRWNIVVAIVAVIFVHGALLIELSLPTVMHARYSATPLRRRHVRQEHDTNIMTLRFIQPSPDGTTQSNKPRRMKPTMLMPATIARSPMPPKGNRKAKNKKHATEVHLSVLPKTLNLTMHHHHSHMFTIGRDLTKDALIRHDIALPGGEAVAGVPHFRMIEPRSQGVAGAVQFIRRNLDVPDSHCFDLDVWLTMSASQRAAHGVSPDDIERIKNKYDCSANKYHVGRVGSPWLRDTYH